MWVLSSPKRGQIYIPCTGRQNPNHWPARELPHLFFFSLILLEYSWFAMLCYFPYLQCLEQGVSQSRCSQKPVLRRRISGSLQGQESRCLHNFVPGRPCGTLAHPGLSILWNPVTSIVCDVSLSIQFQHQRKDIIGRNLQTWESHFYLIQYLPW